MYRYDWKPYVPVAKRRRQARKKMESLRKKGVDIQPIEIEGRKIAKTFWGEAWCDHIESFNDYENRLPRGRTYVRNGSVCHLAVTKGKVQAKVSGSDIYDIRVGINTLPAKKWGAIKRQCSGQIGSLLELLRGELSDNIMQVVTDRKSGLFPLSGEISFDCDCPDWAVMCKHVAAVLYGIGARLDQNPALLFLLRGVHHDELIDEGAQVAVPTASRRSSAKRLAANDLGDVFGIDLAADDLQSPPKTPSKTKKKAKKKTTRKKASKPKTPPHAKGKAKKKVAAKEKIRGKKKTPAKSSAKRGPQKSTAGKKKTVSATKKATAKKPKKKTPSKKKVAANRVKAATHRKSAKRKAKKKTRKNAK